MSEWMLWGRFGGSVQLGSAPPPRLYLIPLVTAVEFEGRHAVSLGHQNRNDRNLEGVTRALERAVSCQSDGVIFPSSFLQAPFRSEVIVRCQNRKLRIVHQMTTESLLSEGAAERLDELLRRLDEGDALNLVFGATSLPRETLLARLTRWPDQVYFTHCPRKGDDSVGLLHSLQPFVRDRLFFHFPFHLEANDGHLSCEDVFHLTEKIRTRVPGVRVRPSLGQELFDPRVDPDLELEPTHQPIFELRSNNGLDHKNRVPIEVSVIIPSYNNRDYLLNTVRHLIRQNLSRSQFEIIVVDDGSNDGSITALKSEMARHEGKINFKYVFSPRSKPRVMGDANYRAGISRNLGVKNATGRILCFLDSDILTPSNFLTDLIEKHRSYDVIQCQRLNLKRELSDSNIQFEKIDPKTDTFSFEGDYWEKFYALKNWSSVPFFWKYTCTYGLSLPAQLFKRVGWIRRGFVFYGFEDVELGYRLAKVGARFHLNNMVTYHLFHLNERSEFQNSDYFRQSLLAKTAQIFYLNRLEPEIFLHFRGLMKEQVSLTDKIQAWTNRFGLNLKIEQVLSKVHVRRLQIPFLAATNWRWFLWHHWNIVKRRAQLWRLQVFAQRAEGALHRLWGRTWRLRVFPQRAKGAFHRLWGQTWRLRVSALRIAGATLPLLFGVTYPVRKIYYFLSYQWKKRFAGSTGERRDLS